MIDFLPSGWVELADWQLSFIIGMGGGKSDSAPMAAPPPPVYVPVAPTQDNTAELAAAKAKLQDDVIRRQQMGGVQGSDITNGTLGSTVDTTVKLKKPTLLGGDANSGK